MTIDERLEKLTERHEALTQSVELMNHIHQERMDKIMEGMEKLLHVAEIHEQRIERLEGEN